MNKTKIEWAEMTWNTFVGCNKISVGCTNCYAERMAWRLANNPKVPAETRAKYQRVVKDGQWTGEVEFFPERLDQPLKARKPSRIFVGSMGDLFHPNMKDEWIDRIFAVMALCPQHQFMVLTKRPERMREYMTEKVCLESRAETIAEEAAWIGKIVWDSRGDKYYLYDRATAKDVANRRPFPGWPLPNVMLGVTAENQKQADKRIPVLLEIPAAKRFVSIEPMIGPVDLMNVTMDLSLCAIVRGPVIGVNRGFNPGGAIEIGLNQIYLGGETGPGARPMHPDWVRKIRDDCQVAGVPLFFKSWGEYLPCLEITELKEPTWSPGYKRYAQKPYLYVTPDGRRDHVARYGSANMIRVGKRRAGHLLDGREHREWPE
jgi:protein gp37